MSKPYGLVNRNNLVPMGNTKKSRYPVQNIKGWLGLNLPIRKKFSTRGEARDYKRELVTKANWVIVHLPRMEVVR